MPVTAGKDDIRAALVSSLKEYFVLLSSAVNQAAANLSPAALIGSASDYAAPFASIQPAATVGYGAQPHRNKARAARAKRAAKQRQKS